jgi:hypothetical protein
MGGGVAFVPLTVAPRQVRHAVPPLLPVR